MPRYLITSSNREEGGVYLADSSTGHVKRVMSGSFRGMTLGPDGCYYVVSGYRDPQEGESVVHRLDLQTWKTEEVARYPLGDCHDLMWHDGYFYLVASVGNQVVRLDEQCRMVDRFQVIEDDRDVCHPNCLTVIDGEIYLSIFTLSPGERKEKRFTGAWHRSGKILKLDWERKKWEVRFEPLAQPHSLIPRDGGIYLVESHTSSLTWVDLQNHKAKHLGQYRGFLRGLAFGPDELAVGACLLQIRDRARLKTLPLFRRIYDKFFPFSGLLVLDSRTWKVKRKIPIPGSDIYDVRLLDGAPSA
ncbi:MAG: DUF4915 domain-containing protein [Armatimonadota bacterium]